MHAHMGGPGDKPNTGSKSGKARWLVKGNSEEMPRKHDSNYQEGMTLSELAPVSIHMYGTSFLSSKHLFHYFPSLCGNSFLHSSWARTLPLSVVAQRLGFSTLPGTAWPQSLARNQNPDSSRHRPRPPEITVNSNRNLLLIRVYYLLKHSISIITHFVSIITFWSRYSTQVYFTKE